jgi:hypothetical protein
MALGSGYNYGGNAYQEALFEAMMEGDQDLGSAEDDLLRQREEVAQLRRPGTGKLDWASQAANAINKTAAGYQAGKLRDANAALGKQRVGIGRRAQELARGKQAGAVLGQMQANQRLGSGWGAGVNPEDYDMSV